jgi:hypothetical protein
VNTWMSLEKVGRDDIQLIFVHSAPGLEEYIRCTSVPIGDRAPQLSQDELRACVRKGDVEHEVYLILPESKRQYCSVRRRSTLRHLSKPALHSNSSQRRMRNSDFQSCERENISHPMTSAEAISRIVSVKS